MFISFIQTSLILNHILKTERLLHHIIPLCLVTCVGLHVVDHVTV